MCFILTRAAKYLQVSNSHLSGVCVDLPDWRVFTVLSCLSNPNYLHVSHLRVNIPLLSSCT